MSARIVSGIYRIRNTVNGRVYVGASVHVEARWHAHRFHLNKGVHDCRPQAKRTRGAAYYTKKDVRR